MSYTLYFHGPYKFIRGDKYIFNSEFVKAEGIYIWTIKDETDGINYIHYIGETASFAKRHREHFTQIAGLSYGILDAELASKGVPKMIWSGMWRDKSPDAVSITIKNYCHLSKKVIDYIGLIDIFFAPTSLKTDIRRHIEGCIGWNLRNNHAEYKLYYPDDNQISIKEDPLNQELIINVSEPVAGIDRKINL